MDNLKRDLVSLLGTLSFYRSLPTSTEKKKESESVRIVQDTTREKGGLFDVMNLTQLDERNPCESSMYTDCSSNQVLIAMGERIRHSGEGHLCSSQPLAKQ